VPVLTTLRGAAGTRRRPVFAGPPQLDAAQEGGQPSRSRQGGRAHRRL